MAELPHMPIATDAILADVGDLENELFGAYTRLLFRWWREGCEPEPNEKKLCRWARCSSDDLEEIKEFLTSTERGWTQKRLFETWTTQIERRDKQRANVLARWHREGRHKDGPVEGCPLCEQEAKELQSNNGGNDPAPPPDCDGNTMVDTTVGTVEHTNEDTTVLPSNADGTDPVDTNSILTINHEPLTNNTGRSSLPSPPAIADASAGPSAEVKTGITSLLAEPIPSFDQFWSAYPKRITETGKAVKGSKSEAKTKWSSLAPKSKREAMEGLAAYAQSAGTKPVDAIRYLRHRRWEDEVEEATPNPNAHSRMPENQTSTRTALLLEEIGGDDEQQPARYAH